MIRKLVPLLFVCLSLLLSKCSEDENPNYPIEPYIEFRSIQFIDTPLDSYPDTIKLILYYRDGDDDLGLDGNVEYINDPFHPYDFYFENGNGELQKFAPQVIVNNTVGWAGYNPEAITQVTTLADRLVTSSTQKKDNYSFLPEFNPRNCLNYQFKTFLVPEDAEYILDEGYEYVGKFGLVNGNSFIGIRDTIYQTINENYFNMLVDFEVSDDKNDWIYFNWIDLFCTTYNARLPILQQNSKIITAGPFNITRRNNWEGTIEYNMASYGFSVLFKEKFLRLKVKIKDRQLHDSNTITTPIIDWGN